MQISDLILYLPTLNIQLISMSIFTEKIHLNTFFNTVLRITGERDVALLIPELHLHCPLQKS